MGRGLSFESDVNQLQAAASKAGKTAQKVSTKVVDATAGPRADLEGALKDLGKTTSSTLDQASKSATSIATDAASKVSSESSDAFERFQKKMKQLQSPRTKSTPGSSTAPPSAKVEEPAQVES